MVAIKAAVSAFASRRGHRGQRARHALRWCRFRKDAPRTACMPSADSFVREPLADEDLDHQLEQRYVKNVGPTSPSCCSSTSTADSSCSDLSEEDEEPGMLDGEEDLDVFLGEPRKAATRCRRAVSGGLTIRELLNREDEISCRKHQALNSSEQPPVLEADDTSSPISDDTRISEDSSTRRVKFDLSATTVHQICPYSEVYGLHPRTFDFDRNFWMVPTKGWQDAVQQSLADADEETESDSDSDEDLWEEWTPPKASIRNTYDGVLVIE
eukprot:TRINITY_DN5241_c0_g1_i2.p1 TRINITY_DN5241_c0_g1~~TRINITY_DN5241_c0_g1_i2.p1  ORF type:complete len:269 (+),score=37.88 TRINITY_DN5241_c0_g1_i2:53-859(+)